MTNRTPFAFHRAYCEGHKSEYGWVADGRSPRADTELEPRLGRLTIKHDRAEYWKNTPPKVRQTKRIDIGAKPEEGDALAKRLPSETHLFKALEATLEKKVDDIVQGVMEELGAGEKCVIWVLTRESVEIMAKALERATENKDARTLMRQKNLRLLATHGEASVKVRHDLAATFRKHKGASALIATMDSMPESISLFGATTAHYAQLHYLPGPMEQTENRPYLEATARCHLIYYVAKYTVDEHVLRILLPRLEAAAKIAKNKDSGAIQKSLDQQKKESYLEVIARLTRRVPDDAVADIGSSGGSDE